MLFPFIHWHFYKVGYITYADVVVSSDSRGYLICCALSGPPFKYVVAENVILHGYKYPPRKINNKTNNNKNRFHRRTENTTILSSFLSCHDEKSERRLNI